MIFISTAKCPTGTYKSSNTICSNCPAGTYNDQQGQLQCTQNCPSGTSSLPGAKSSSDCKREFHKVGIQEGNMFLGLVSETTSFVRHLPSLQVAKYVLATCSTNSNRFTFVAQVPETYFGSSPCWVLRLKSLGLAVARAGGCGRNRFEYL